MQLDSQVEESDSLPPQKLLRLSMDDSVGVVDVETENSINEEVSHLVSEEEFH